MKWPSLRRLLTRRPVAVTRAGRGVIRETEREAVEELRDLIREAKGEIAEDLRAKDAEIKRLEDALAIERARVKLLEGQLKL